MKPNFALSLSFDGIGLLHRRFPGWTLVDEVTLDTDDLSAALAELRSKAIALDASGLRTKLVIPNDQIKYLSIPVPGDDPEMQALAVLAALEGATPYRVDELVYDWTADGPDLKIAAVARETLDEAEAFAVDHAYAPVCFVATPANDDFSGEPFFGETAHARTILPDEGRVARDTAPIRIIGTSKPLAASEAATPVVAAEDGEPPAPDPDLTAVPETASGKGKNAPAKKPESASKSKSEAPVKTDEALAKPFTSIRASRGDVPGTAPKLSAPSRLHGLIASRTDGALRPGAAKADQTPTPELSSPGAEATPDTTQLAQAAASLRPDPAERLHSPEAAADADSPPRVAFFSGRKPRSTQAEARPKSASHKPDNSAKTRFEDEKQRMTVFGARQSQVGGKPRFLGLILTAALLLFLVVVAAWASIYLDDGLARLFGGPKEVQVADDAPATTTEPDDAPLADAALPAATDTDTDTGASTEPTDNAGTDMAGLTPQAAPLPEPPAAEVVETPAADQPAAETSTPPVAPEPLTPSASLARYAATGIWQLAPEPPAAPRASGDAERVFRISVDPDVHFNDPATLPRDVGTQRDAPPETPALPYAPGVTFDINENGLVRATPEGAMTPQGVRVHAARPVIEPPATMQRSTPTEPGVPEVIPDPSDTAQEAEPVEVAEPTSPLAAIRPRLRPAGIAPETEDAAGAEPGSTETEADPEPLAETDTEPEAQGVAQDEVSLSAADTALAGFRPRARPDSITARTETVAAETGDNVTEPDALEAAIALANASDTTGEERDQTLFENATPQAVTASLTPLTRPKNFAAIVERAQDSASAQPVATAQAMAPPLPSTASVAKEATERNVLNLRNVNLIGVYGAPTSRRALVRLSNGRYKKVKVGDKLDGGKVAAIGDSELHYVKRGKSVTLRMPKG